MKHIARVQHIKISKQSERRVLSYFRRLHKLIHVINKSLFNHHNILIYYLNISTPINMSNGREVIFMDNWPFLLMWSTFLLVPFWQTFSAKSCCKITKPPQEFVITAEFQLAHVNIPECVWYSTLWYYSSLNINVKTQACHADLTSYLQPFVRGAVKGGTESLNRLISEERRCL